MPKLGEWSKSPSGKYEYSEKFILEVLNLSNLSLKNYPLELKKGFFSETLPKHPDRPIAILHIDGDLYQSYRDCLEYLYQNVSSGGLIIFDDFMLDEEKNEKFPGARKAVQEFLLDDYKNLQRSIGGNPYYCKP